MSMPPVLTESVSSRSHPKKSEKEPGIDATNVLQKIGQHVLLDGFKIVVDLDKSRGSYLYDTAGNRRLIDVYGFFGSMPVGFNHPYFDDPEVQQDLLRAAKFKVANSDIYSQSYAEFIDTFAGIVGLPPLDRYLFIEGGALAVENTLKAAMDWKVRQNMAAGRGERGTEILHFRHAFHGRSGYTMSLTNTDPRKTDLFAKFEWPRVSTPCIDFSLPEIADEHDILLIFDEVQCGMGATGRNWCCQHFDVLPDLMAFGKKAQVCGVMAGPRLDQVKDNAFRLPRRLNSTWGGNFTDMVRSKHFLRIIEGEHLVENAAKVGTYFLDQLLELQREQPMISAVRGRGLFLAFDLADAKTREKMWKGLFDLGLLTLRSGENSIRFRPALDITAAVIDEAMDLIRKQCQRMQR